MRSNQQDVKTFPLIEIKTFPCLCQTLKSTGEMFKSIGLNVTYLWAKRGFPCSTIEPSRILNSRPPTLCQNTQIAKRDVQEVHWAQGYLTLEWNEAPEFDDKRKVEPGAQGHLPSHERDEASVYRLIEASSKKTKPINRELEKGTTDRQCMQLYVVCSRRLHVSYFSSYIHTHTHTHIHRMGVTRLDRYADDRIDWDTGKQTKRIWGFLGWAGGRSGSVMVMATTTQTLKF